MKTLKVLISFDNSDRSVNPQDIFFLLRNGREKNSGSNKTAEKNYIHLFSTNGGGEGFFMSSRNYQTGQKLIPFLLKSMIVLKYYLSCVVTHFIYSMEQLLCNRYNKCLNIFEWDW